MKLHLDQVLTEATKQAPRHIKGMLDLRKDLEEILEDAIDLKAAAKHGTLPPLLAGKTVLLLFEKNSTRTRISFEVGIQKLGGIVSTLDANGSQLARGESLEDTGAVLSRYSDALVYRAKDHQSLLGLAQNASVPVVNALTDLEHPCQILADWMALLEAWGSLKGKTFAYVGDGNNVCQSYLLGAPLVGMDIHVATPPGFEPEAHIVAQAKVLAQRAGTKVVLTHSPEEAVAGAHAVATDTWISMGDEVEQDARLQAFADFTVDDALMDQAGPEALFLHCLPGHWGLEATHEVAHGPRSLILEEAENRMWAQMALLARLLG